MTGVKIKDNETGKEEIYPTQGFFLAIGHKPNTEFLKDFITLDKNGYVVVNKTTTNIPGIFAAGDCVDYEYRQAIVAAGMGCMAALDAQKWLENQ